MVDAVNPSPAISSGLSSALGASQAAEEAKAASAESDFDDFLTLLTSQLRHQDPLQPLDSTQFVEQLASFSAVEQQVGMNARLDTLIAQGGGSEVSGLAAWMGQEVEGRSVSYSFDGSRLTVTPPQGLSADSAAMVILDADSQEIARVPFEPGVDEVAWNGQTTEGTRADAGLYTLRFHYETEGQEPRIRDAETSGRVVEARIETEGARLVLDTGATVLLDDVTRLTAPQDT